MNQEVKAKVSIGDGNFLISKFMGDYDGEWLAFQWIAGNFRYDNDWNLLMKVVEKISNYHYPDYWSDGKPEDAGEYDDCAYMRTFGMRDKEGNYMVRINASSLIFSPTLIQATWLAVIDFITWFNSLK